MSEIFSIETSNSQRLSYFYSLAEALCAASDEVMDNDTVDVYNHALLMKLDSRMLCNALNGSPPAWHRRRICQMKRDNQPRVIKDCGSKFFTAPDSVDGCHWQAWGGPFGITRDGVVFDGSKGGAIGTCEDLPEAERWALSNEMRDRWFQFGACDNHEGSHE